MYFILWGQGKNSSYLFRHYNTYLGSSEMKKSFNEYNFGIEKK